MAEVKKKTTNFGTDWEILSQRTEAKVARSYMHDGNQRNEQETYTGTPEEVRRYCSPKNSGEATEIDDVHTITRLAYEEHVNTTHGLNKRRVVDTIQTRDFGDGKSVAKELSKKTGIPFTEQGLRNQTSNDEEDCDCDNNCEPPCLVQHKEDNRHSEHDNRADHRMLWITILGLTIMLVGAMVAIMVR